MPITQLEKSQKFRALHYLPAAVGDPIEPAPPGAKAFVIPNPWDPGSARILAGLGFEALATTSAGFAFTLGRSDGEVKREEALAHSAAIAAATDLPVSADLENTFGHVPRFVAQTIRLAGATGIVGGSVEDATGNENRPIYDHEHAVVVALEALGVDVVVIVEDDELQPRRTGRRRDLFRRAAAVRQRRVDVDDAGHAHEAIGRGVPGRRQRLPEHDVERVEENERDQDREDPGARS